jgi:hypothetical protein
MEKRIIRIPRGARIGPDQEPIYGWLEVEAYCKGGLCVHKRLDKGARWKWSVTHEASGMGLPVIGADTKRETAANVEAALALDFDWTMSEEDTIAAFRKDRSIVDAVRKIGERY